ncbi:uncharacterized protein [Rutidosis leptorrhynchoides]|uniref:uncharacterized protein n=1 Tax=Rutidosis leptorrhynchoides TaxID=125765 RepID=UPI003A99B5C6
MVQPNFQSPLYLHPFDRPSSLTIQEKLSGVQNYRSWRRSMDIALSSKRKIGFVTGTIALSYANQNEAELWDTSATEIWSQLEKKIALSNDSRKYKLNKETYTIEQQGMPVNEYYNKIKCVWEELDSLNQLPRVNDAALDVVALLAAINLQKGEHHLF